VREASLRITPADSTGFAPAFSYPDLTDAWEEYFAVAGASLNSLGNYAGHRLILLDLMKNPATRTTKTTASLLIVARAVWHIQTTGDSVLLFTPSSGNKAVALRDAVARALELRLVTPDRLRIVTLTPSAALYKLRRNLLTESDELRVLNPILVYPGQEPGDVKHIGREWAHAAAARTSARVWYSLDIANYKVADACRAFYEHEFGDFGSGRRLHAHAVSSAYGLLGYQHGINTMAALGITHPQPGFLLVQHLATSDMVRHYLRSTTGTEPRPDWKRGEVEDVYEQRQLPHSYSCMRQAEPAVCASSLGEPRCA
jgi:hypothetical protein